MIDFCVLGSGIAGSTIARLLSNKYTVEVFDKARGPGGRSSNKRFKLNMSFDHGVQYISPKNNKFKKFITRLTKKKILKIWDGNHLDFTFKNEKHIERYIGKKANNDICKYNLKNIKQKYFAQITKIRYRNKLWEITLKDKKRYTAKALILTCPYPQLKKLAKSYLHKKIIDLRITMLPNITLMLGIKNQRKLLLSSIKFNNDILSWAANENSKKRFKSHIDLWTLQSSLKWSKKNINHCKNNNKIINELQSIFLKLTGFDKKNIVFKKIHGWKYSYSYDKPKINSYWLKKYNLGICADWLSGPKVEDAWLSANDLYKKVKKNPLIKRGF